MLFWKKGFCASFSKENFSLSVVVVLNDHHSPAVVHCCVLCCSDSSGSVCHWVLQSCPHVLPQHCRAQSLGLKLLLQGPRRKEKGLKTLLSFFFAVLITQKAHLPSSTFLHIWVLEDAENREAWNL